jgi:uncharacterized alpha-E superfamily protein
MIKSGGGYIKNDTRKILKKIITRRAILAGFICGNLMRDEKFISLMLGSLFVGYHSMFGNC